MLESMFGPYRIEELLGRGGMGEVYRAYDTQTDRTVALKLLPSHLAEDDEYQARFRRECKVAARLNEPHVVPIHRFGDIDGRLYLDMRLVKGTDLGAWLREHGPMPPDVAVAVIGQVAQALDAAHSDGLVHRDVKPSNVLLAGISGRDVDAASVFAYLFDFGIARAREGALAPDEVSLTMAGVLPGSPSYVAPERFAGVEGDPRADVYALACVLHQALTGRPPFEGDLPSLMRAHLQTPPPRASTLRPGVPSGLDDVVGKGMAKDPDRRYSTAGELAAAARAVLSTGSGVTSVDSGSTVRIGGGAPPRKPTGPTPVTTPRPLPSSPGERRPGGPTRPVPASAAEHAGSRPAIVRPAAAPRTWQPPPPVVAAAPDPAPPRASSNGRLLWVAGVLVIVVAVVSGLLLTSFGRSSSQGSAPPSGAPTPAAATEDGRLLAGLPAGFGTANCQSAGAMRDQVGALSYVECGSGPANGPDKARFARFSSADGLATEFLRSVEEAAIVAAPGQQIDVCATGASTRGTWGLNNDGVVRGEVACVVDANSGGAYLLWTEMDTQSYGYVMREDGNAKILYDWWNTAEFRKL